MSSPIGEATFDRIDRDAVLIALVGMALQEVSASMLGRIVQRRSMLLSIGAGKLSGFGLAAALFCDFAALKANGEIEFAGGSTLPAVSAALLRRTGREAESMLLRQVAGLGAAEAHQAGIVDALVPPEADSLEWARKWIGGRSILALQSGATLLRQRHPFAERAEFARLFSTAEPRHGMRMFLTRSPLDFSDRYQVETI